MLPAEVQSIIANIGSLADQLQQYERGEDSIGDTGEPPEEGEEVGKAKVNKSVDKILAMFADLEENEKAAALAALQALSTSGEAGAGEELPEPDVAMDAVGKAGDTTGTDDADKRLTGYLPDGTVEAIPEIEKAVDAAKSLVEAGVLKWADKNEAAMVKVLAKSTATIAKAMQQQATVIKSLQASVEAAEETIGEILEGLGVAKAVTKSLDEAGAGNGNGGQRVVKAVGGGLAVESLQQTAQVLKELLGLKGGKVAKSEDEDPEEEGQSPLLAGRRKEAVAKSLRGALKGGLFTSGRV